MLFLRIAYLIILSLFIGECACLNSDYDEGSCDDDHPLRWCINCTDSMGPGCDYPCIHGSILAPPTVQCECESCYDDEACSVLCGGHGNCSNDTCICEEGYKGDYCRELDCPGRKLLFVFVNYLWIVDIRNVLQCSQCKGLSVSCSFCYNFIITLNSSIQTFLCL